MKVKFVPQDVEFEIKQGQTVMDLAHEKGIPVRSTCNGMPSCAECRVRVIDGDWNTNPPSRKELSLIGTGYYIDQRRLSCQMLCFGDITVDTTEQIEKGAEGPVTKKFLAKVHKDSAEQSHSLGGVMLEENEDLIHDLQKDIPTAPQPNTQAGLTAPGERRPQQGGGRGGGGRDRGRGGRDGGRNRGGGGQAGGGPRGPAPDRTANAGGAPRTEGGGGASGGGGRRRRRGGRGRSGGGSGGGGGNRGGGAAGPG